MSPVFREDHTLEPIPASGVLAHVKIVAASAPVSDEGVTADWKHERNVEVTLQLCVHTDPPMRSIVALSNEVIAAILEAQAACRSLNSDA